MSIPKSVVKINKDGVRYESFSDQAQYYLFELAKAGLRDVGKFVKTEFRKRYYSHFKRHTGNGAKAVKVHVYSNKNTLYPHIDIGLPHARKGVEVPGFYSFFQELGTSKTPKLGLLTKSVEENVAQIVEIESQYLSNLSKEASRLNRLIDEDEYED